MKTVNRGRSILSAVPPRRLCCGRRVMRFACGYTRHLYLDAHRQMRRPFRRCDLFRWPGRAETTGGKL